MYSRTQSRPHLRLNCEISPKYAYYFKGILKLFLNNVLMTVRLLLNFGLITDHKFYNNLEFDGAKLELKNA